MTVNKKDEDCRFLLSEIERQNDTLDRLTAERIIDKELDDCLSTEKIVERELERLRTGQERDKLAAEDLIVSGRHLEEHHTVGNGRLTQTSSLPSKSIRIPTTSDGKDTQKVTVIRISSEDVEREDNDEINARYERLKESVGALKQDVSDVRLFRVHSSKRNGVEPPPAQTRNRDHSWSGRPKRPDHTGRLGKKSVRIVT